MLWEWAMSNLDRMQPGLTIEPPDGRSCPGGFAFAGEANLGGVISQGGKLNVPFGKLTGACACAWAGE